MKSLQIQFNQQNISIVLKNQKYDFPRDKCNTQLLYLLYPFIEQAKAEREIVTRNLLPQYQISCHLCCYLSEKLQVLRMKEEMEEAQELEMVLQLALERNFFLQDLLKKLEIEIPVEFYLESGIFH